MWRMTIIAFAVLASCALEAPSQDVETRALAIQENAPNAEEVAGELIGLYQELAAVLEARGVALEEMQAAVEAGDAERVRELFGFAPEEFEAANERVAALAAKVQRVLLENPEAGAVHPEGLECQGTFACGVGVVSLAAYFPQYAAAILIAGGLGCAWETCHWKDGSGPRSRQP